ncbi:nicolin-1 isoform X1 [Denticeps clupeoides]|uniref:Nicolin-1 n=1 Tax=Denticeps clupeoides TaxID=299321 RepID=A0AAY4B1Q2_9TELE|nr:nicolin-1 isoform X1 [Denticeps clupeoides]XP_028854210.1 nicolin-1 isoform X1 [Denticeps clupeoides]
MIIEPVDCVVKAPVSLQIGDSIRPGVYVIDINFPNGQAVKIQEIQFKNYYTAFLTVRVLKMEDPGHDSTVKWVTALRDLQLMPNPHSEAGSQDYFAVHKHQMLVEMNDVSTIRLILRQPSAAWLNFTIDEIKIYKCLKEESEIDVPNWLSNLTPVEESSDLQGLPDPENVSSSIQQMWALTEIMQSNRTTVSIGRFDVKGCYEINLLSYS